MRCMLTVRMDNAAFADVPGDELASILRKLATRVEDCGIDDFDAVSRVHDSNGNMVGELTFNDV